MSVCGLDLRTSFSSHGQLYVACSHEGKLSNLYILTKNRLTKNIVNSLALRDLHYFTSRLYGMLERTELNIPETEPSNDHSSIRVSYMLLGDKSACVNGLSGVCDLSMELQRLVQLNVFLTNAILWHEGL